MVILLVTLIVNIISVFVNCQDPLITKIDYYEQLINYHQKKAANYEIPTRNEEFKVGYESEFVNDFGSFDFIVVGAGSGGSVMATRLSEIADWNILLIEAGGEENDFSKIPSMYTYLQFTEMNWGYYTTPQKTSCLGMRNQQCMAPRGKVIGGSSAINNLKYIRANKRDFEQWVNLGNAGWSWNEVLPYFKKSENSQINGDAGYHGKGGFWNVNHAAPSKIYDNFLDANRELNISVGIDCNGVSQLGVSKTPINTKNGRRQSLGTAFLSNARSRKNLQVVTKALVTKIIIDQESFANVAKGVLFIKDDRKFMAKATKEVILSAGAFNSPQLLMLSGVGPENHLKELGIKPIRNLPVGENYVDDLQFNGFIFHTNYSLNDNLLRNQIKEYFEGNGPLVNPGNTDAISFLHTGEVPKEVPMLMYTFIPPNCTIPIQNKVYNFNEHLTKNFLNNVTPKNDFAIYLGLLHEKSRGSITLKSNNPIDFPNINPNLFSDPNNDDIKNLRYGIKFILKLIQTEGFKRINTTLLEIPLCRDHKKDTDHYWDCVIHQITQTMYHPLGTTAMGSVVDHNLKILGVSNLRVVDAGVVPVSISGYLNAVVVMIAEKTSDAIKKEHGITDL